MRLEDLRGPLVGDPAMFVALSESAAGFRLQQRRLVRSKRDGFLDRWSSVARWFSESADSAPKATTQRVRELRDFRNAFEHASRLGTIEVRASRLGTLPAYANLSDAMEAMAICIEASSVLRY